MIALRLQNLSKTYTNGIVGVRHLNLEVLPGELMVLVGPSGCGKTTSLRLIAGLESPSEGKIQFGEKDVTRLPPHLRNVGMVFQSHALYPHLSVKDNLAFGLRTRRTAANIIAHRIDEIASLLELQTLLNRMPSELSGGQQQRVALGRALVRQPDVCLLDEPLSSLDLQTRQQMRSEIKRLQQKLGTTMIFVTHDQEEAMTLGDRIAILRDGELQQTGKPLDVYHRPTNRFVAEFLGNPAMNFLPASVREIDGRLVLRNSGDHFPEVPIPTRVAQHLGSAREITVGIRPRDIQLTTASSGRCTGVVEQFESRGEESLVVVRTSEPGQVSLRVVVASDHRYAAGETVGVGFNTEKFHFFDPTGRRLDWE